ncbi:DUF58 domain-containing protein [Priestia flexa]|jgi:uncharacterized protein (DUF58 family)|uniref:DUF58 domain-containing protein n=1 Tax=Priestia flexa TaxID=86664 RepID=A0A8I1MKK0_9BACI|nr:DUF58 domain-containing protein [Priestia flexa]MBN8253972.1 DUF58 domain-containing protein [Priestia flexa]MBN8436385.1 DUF58 domain-containing protein [Priestia flexa]MCA0968882.1 DUF58 domain-containing protein [Priestia flexa]UIR30244.1 DUF58 domain-containing protein [Priestia flexa]UZW66772.1 DUF58 domain-containing protein [Priestia flexa]
MAKLSVKRQPVISFLLLVVLLVATFAYAMFQGGFVSWFLFYSFLPFGLYGIVIAFYPMKSWQVERVMTRTQYEAKESVYYKVHIKRNSFFPLYNLSVEDICKEADLSLRKVVYPLWKKDIVIEFEIPSLERGEYNLTGISIEMSDLLGIVHRQQVFVTRNQLIMYPHLIQVKPTSSQWSEGEKHFYKRSIAENTMLATGVREYEQGDRLSTIDWKATARKGTLISKEFEKMSDLEEVLIFDGVDPTDFEERTGFMASMILSYLNQHKPASFIHGGSSSRLKELHGGAQHERGWLAYFARVQPIRNGKLTIPKGLSHAVTVISSSMTSELIQEVQAKVSPQTKVTLFIIQSKQDGRGYVNIPRWDVHFIQFPNPRSVREVKKQ